jgi:hypothetical protein
MDRDLSYRILPRAWSLHIVQVNCPRWLLSCPWLFLFAMIANAQTDIHFPEVNMLPSQTEMPDPLRMLSGEKITTREDWEQKRRPELKQLFQHYMYGFLPPPPQETRFEMRGEFEDALEGRATLKLITLITGGDGAPRIDLALFVPKNKARPAPTFLAMNFCGNHAICHDPRIPLPTGWFNESCGRSLDGRATESSRGSQASDWNLTQTIEHGYAVATFCSSDIDADRKDVSEGIYAWLARPKIPVPQDRGTIAAWAWGFHRCIDYLVSDPDVDSGRIAAVGHSRNGKTALLAAAFDERIALVIPHQAGCGGTAPSRGKVGESVERINQVFPHWFNAEFKKFNSDPSRLPFDQHSLIALVAPRPILLSNAAEDTWANPEGQFEMLKAAASVYSLLGVTVRDLETRPEEGRLLNGSLGYYIRAGKHSMTSDDWRVFLEFADSHFRTPR